MTPQKAGRKLEETTVVGNTLETSVSELSLKRTHSRRRGGRWKAAWMRRAWAEWEWCGIIREVWGGPQIEIHLGPFCYSEHILPKARMWSRKAKQAFAGRSISMSKPSVDTVSFGPWASVVSWCSRPYYTYPSPHVFLWWQEHWSQAMDLVFCSLSHLGIMS